LYSEFLDEHCDVLLDFSLDPIKLTEAGIKAGSQAGCRRAESVQTGGYHSSKTHILKLKPSLSYDPAPVLF
jgi:hypothetical protein